MDNRIKIVQYKFFSTVVADIIKAIDGGSLTGAYTLAFCCIDYLGLALNPAKKNTKEDFLKYTNEYLGRINNNYTTYAEHLYAIRCSLVHSFGPSDATEKLDFTPFLEFHDEYDNNEKSREHFYIDQKNKKLHITLHPFISELIASICLFFMEQNDPNIFEVWEHKLFYSNSIRDTLIRKEISQHDSFEYNKIHQTLRILDNEKNLSKIQSNINEKLKETIKTFIPLLKFKDGYIDTNQH